MDVQAVGVVILQVGLNLSDQLGIVGTLVVEPEYRRHAAGAGTVDGQLHPVPDRQIFGLTGPPDVTLLNVMLGQHSTVFCNHPDNTVFLDFEGLVVGTVLFRFLRHQADVGYGTHGGRIKRTMRFAEIDRFLVDGGVSGLGHHCLGVFQLAITGPHLAGVTDHRGHGGIHDHVAGNVQVGDAFYRIHHGNFGAVLVALVQVFLDLFLLGFRQMLDFFEYRRKTVVRVNTDFIKI